MGLRAGSTHQDGTRRRTNTSAAAHAPPTCDWRPRQRRGWRVEGLAHLAGRGGGEEGGLQGLGCLLRLQLLHLQRTSVRALVDTAGHSCNVIGGRGGGVGRPLLPHVRGGRAWSWMGMCGLCCEKLCPLCCARAALQAFQTRPRPPDALQPQRETTAPTCWRSSCTCCCTSVTRALCSAS